MRKGISVSIICRGFCRFYKPGKKEDLRCGAYDFLAANLTEEELKLAALSAVRRCDYSRDREIRELICSRCEFRVDGCDFREGLASPPCGGYAIVERLLKQKYVV
jgi:hypothetical protein